MIVPPRIYHYDTLSEAPSSNIVDTPVETCLEVSTSPEDMHQESAKTS